MKVFRVFLFIIFLFCYSQIHAQTSQNWTSNQLMDPAELAVMIQKNKDLPVLFSIGPGAIIPNSIAIGMAKDEVNLEKLKKELKGISKRTGIVIYCGCCPFDRCPNIRPALQLLKNMKFTNYKLLNLPHNIKADWLDKGYPAVK